MSAVIFAISSDLLLFHSSDFTFVCNFLSLFQNNLDDNLFPYYDCVSVFDRSVFVTILSICLFSCLLLVSLPISLSLFICLLVCLSSCLLACMFFSLFPLSAFSLSPSYTHLSLPEPGYTHHRCLPAALRLLHQFPLIGTTGISHGKLFYYAVIQNIKQGPSRR